MDTEAARFGPEAGPEEQERLRRGRVLIVGIGGLGSPAALHLASAGIGTLGLIDFDAVDLSNLHRPIIYRTPDIGRPKATVAAERLRAAYPDVSVECFQERLSPANLAEIFPGMISSSMGPIGSQPSISSTMVPYLRRPFRCGVGFDGQR